MMWTLLLAALFHGAPAHAGDDPDLHRKVEEGRQIYTGERLAIGAVAEAFLLQYPDQPAWNISASRYEVDFEGAGFEFRNRAAYPVDTPRRGKWLRVVFEVLAVLEAPIEVPKGSGTWSWKLTYDCAIRSVEEPDR